jgi:hypothetical protein
VVETDADGKSLVADTLGGLGEGSVLRASWVTDAASPARSDTCDSAFSVVDSVLVFASVIVRACVDVALVVGNASADGVVEVSCCSLEVFSTGLVVGEGPGIAGNSDQSLEAHATRTPRIASITPCTVITPVGNASTVSSLTSVKHPISPL